MKISEFIARLTDLQEIAEEDVEVTVGAKYFRYEPAICELTNVVPIGPDQWKCQDKGNTHQVVSIC